MIYIYKNVILLKICICDAFKSQKAIPAAQTQLREAQGEIYIKNVRYTYKNPGLHRRPQTKKAPHAQSVEHLFQIHEANRSVTCNVRSWGVRVTWFRMYRNGRTVLATVKQGYERRRGYKRAGALSDRTVMSAKLSFQQHDRACSDSGKDEKHWRSDRVRTCFRVGHRRVPVRTAT